VIVRRALVTGRSLGLYALIDCTKTFGDMESFPYMIKSVRPGVERQFSVLYVHLMTGGEVNIY
jgi:hypothetical protein